MIRSEGLKFSVLSFAPKRHLSLGTHILIWDAFDGEQTFYNAGIGDKISVFKCLITVSGDPNLYQCFPLAVAGDPKVIPIIFGQGDPELHQCSPSAVTPSYPNVLTQR